MKQDPALFDPIFDAAGQAWNVNPQLLKAIMMQESGGNWQAVSKAGAQGLMQFMPSTAKSLGVENAFDPVQAIWGAAKYMDQALSAENGSVQQALLYYHGGPGWRQSYGRESASYVPGVVQHYGQLGPLQTDLPTQTAPAPGGTDQTEQQLDEGQRPEEMP